MFGIWNSTSQFAKLTKTKDKYLQIIKNRIKYCSDAQYIFFQRAKHIVSMAEGICFAR